MDKIRDFKPKNQFFLAPMLEPNDIAFRLLCQKAGAGLTYTGMTNPLSKQKIWLDDTPVLQLFGKTAKGIKEFIKTHDSKVSFWDFNLACPSKLSRKLGHGAFLQKDISKIKKILKEIRSTTTKPLTIKLRKTKHTLNVIRKTLNFIDAIAIHPRTIEQGYSGQPDIPFALKIKKEFPLPIIYSGNVSKLNAKSLAKEFNFLHIGRNAIGNPSIFSELTNTSLKPSFKDYLKLAEKYNLPFRQIKYQAMVFTKSKPSARKLRAQLVRAKTIKKIKEIYKIKSIKK